MLIFQFLTQQSLKSFPFFEKKDSDNHIDLLGTTPHSTGWTAQAVCICTGTNCGMIKSIAGSAAILPQVLSLTPLVSEYGEFGNNLLSIHQSCSQYPEIEIDSDKDLIDALAYHSYQIPRLLFVAHSVWFYLRKQGTTNSREFYIQALKRQQSITMVKWSRYK